MLALVASHPGLTVGEIARRLSIRNGTLFYHLQRAEADGHVTTRTDGRRRLVFPAGASLEDAKVRALNLLRGETALEVARAVADAPGISLFKLFAELDTAPRTVYYHVKRLRDAGIIVSAGRRRYHELRPSAILLEVLKTLEPCD